MRKPLLLLALSVFFCFSLSGADKKITSISDCNTGTFIVSIEEETTPEYAARAVIPNATFVYVNSAADGFLSVTSGHADAFACDRSTFESALKHGIKGLKVFGRQIGETGNAVAGISPKSSLKNADKLINDFISEMKRNGTIADMHERWVIDGNETMPDIPAPKSPSLKIRIGTTGLVPPYSFYKDNKLTGYEIELIKRFALWANAEVEVSVYNWESITAACTSGKIDYIMSNLFDTPETAQAIGFSIPYEEVHPVLIVKDDTAEQAANPAVTEEQAVAWLGRKKIGICTGTLFDIYSKQILPGAQLSYFDSYADLSLAVRNNKIDGFLIDQPLGRILEKKQPDLAAVKLSSFTDRYAFIWSKHSENSKCRKELDDFIRQSSKNGFLKELDTVWFGDDEDRKKQFDFNTLPAQNGKIKVGFSAINSDPFCYYRGENLIGYEVELIYRFCAEYGYGAEITTYTNPAGLIMGITSGKIELGGGSVSVTEERAKSVTYSESDYTGGVSVVVRRSDFSRKNISRSDSFFTAVRNSFIKTFIREDRWKLIISGLLVTVLISVLSALFGTAFGFLLCLMRRSTHRPVGRTAAVFIRIIQGIPVVVLLMVLYYIVFASVQISGIIVAVIGFSVNFGVYVSEMMRTGIEAVDKGQWEASDALGFSHAQTFMYVIAPQAARHTLPVYKGEFISMVKMTSVVGYITVQDLTKASDIIRSRTFDAFFPLISSAVIYFVLAWSLTLLLGLIEVRIDPKKRSRKIRNINTDRSSDMASKQETPCRENAGQGGVLINVEHLCKSFPNITPVRDLSVSVRCGDVITIIGPSGTGKSTFLRCLNRLEQPTSGTITAFGENICSKQTDICRLRRRMGMVFQNFNLFPHLTVAENIMLAPRKLLSYSPQQAYDDAVHLLSLVGLSSKADAYPDELSGGQKQRVAIARALAMNPEIILFDEPTSALDPTMVSEVLSVIRNLAKQGLTMMIVTHEMNFAHDVSTRVLYLDDGIVYEEGSPDEIFLNPQKSKTRAFIRKQTIFEKEITSAAYDFYEFNAQLETFGRDHTV